MSHPPYEASPGLPSFSRPPVAEVVVGVEFEPIPQLGAVGLVRLADRWADEYPTVTEVPALPPTFGRGSMLPPEALGDDVATLVPMLRLWLISKSNDFLVQIQNDRLLLNWRRIAEEHNYPRYRSALRDRFAGLWGDFKSYLESIGGGPARTTFVESTFVNRYVTVPGPAESSQAGLSFVNALPAAMPGAGQELHFQVVRDLGDGQLTVKGSPGLHDGRSIYNLHLVTKLQTSGSPDIGDILPVLDRAHDCSVTAFGATTSDEKHQAWHREAI